MSSSKLDPLPQDVIDSLLARAGRGAELGLGRMHDAMGALGHPERCAPAIHIAGTNGKGSVCAMVAAIARHAGLRVGLYTSPHLSRYAERIRIDGEPVETSALELTLRRVLRLDPPLTFFELLTAAAFESFRERDVDLMVLEVGLGGRLDATNILEAPLCTAVTSIGFDHMDYLGSSLPAIAVEKAGIARAEVPLVLGRMPAEASVAIRSEARRVGVRSVMSVEDPAGDAGFDAIEAGTWDRARDVRTNLPGPHQRDNAVVAALCCELAGRWASVLRPSVESGLLSVAWPARLESIEHRGRTVLLDGAHNPAATEMLVRALMERPAMPDRLVYGALADKAYPASLELLASHVALRYYAPPKGRAPAEPESLCEVAQGGVYGSGIAALEAALADAQPGETILVTGSLYLVGEAWAYLRGDGSDPAVGL